MTNKERIQSMDTQQLAFLLSYFSTCDHCVFIFRIKEQKFEFMEATILEYEKKNTSKKRGVHDDVSTSLLHSFLLTNPLEIERENRRKLD